MPRQPSLDELDLSKLSEQEEGALRDYLNRGSTAWVMAVICAVISSLALVLIIQAGAFGEPGTWNVIIKILGYLALGFWARSWSLPAAFALLAWHVYSSYPYIGASQLQLKLHFWIPLFFFLWSCLQAWGRGVLIQKATPGGVA
jgi:hypothetical protein